MLQVTLSLIVICLIASVYSAWFIIPFVVTIWSLHQQREALHDREALQELEIKGLVDRLQVSVSELQAEIEGMKSKNKELNTLVNMSTRRL